MSSKQAKSASTDPRGNNGVNKSLPPFVSCELSDEQKAFIKNHLPEFSECVDNLDRLVRDGFKLSVRFEDRSMAFLATLTGPERDHDCAGLALSSRGPSIHAVLGVLFYKHFEILAEDWRTAAISGGKRDSWG